MRPYSRASDYFPTREAAEAELAVWDTVRPSARTPGFHPDPDMTVTVLSPAASVAELLAAFGYDDPQQEGTT